MFINVVILIVFVIWVVVEGIGCFVNLGEIEVVGGFMLVVVVVGLFVNVVLMWLLSWV